MYQSFGDDENTFVDLLARVQRDDLCSNEGVQNNPYNRLRSSLMTVVRCTAYGTELAAPMTRRA